MSAYKNPNLIPKAVANDWLRARRERAEALRVLKLIYYNKDTRLGVDEESNEPLSEIIGRTIENIEFEESP